MTGVSGYGRNPYQAVQDLRSSLQRVISCVTPSVVTVQSAKGYAVGSMHALVVGSPEPTGLPGSGVALSIRVYAHVAERTETTPWLADVASYFYSFRDLEGREVVAHHWHPESRSPVTLPHLYLGAGIGREDFRKAHFPTGRVEIEDVLLMAIREFGVSSRRDDWEEMLGSQ